MPKALQEVDIDPIAEQVDQEMMETGEEVGIAQHRFDPTVNYAVGRDVPVNFDKTKREPGRPVVRNVWMWDGRPSTIPLAYDASGKRHDGGRKYLLKRHCTACKYTGFYGAVCPQCRKDGRRLVPSVQAFYLRKEQVPAQGKFFGTVDCFLKTCVRRGEYGFVDEAQMREHAQSRHRREYQAFKEAQQSKADGDLAQLREQLRSQQEQMNALIAAALARQPVAAPQAITKYPPKTPEQKERINESRRQRRAQARAAGDAA